MWMPGCDLAMSSAYSAKEADQGRAHSDYAIVQACATSFTMFLGGIVLNALTSSVVQNIPFTILSDMLPPEQLG